MSGYEGYQTVTPKFRMAFVNVFEPRKKKNPTDKDKFGLTMLFEDGEDLAEIKEMGRKLMTEKFGPDPKAWPKGWRKPWRDQSDKDVDNEDATSKQYDGFVSGRLFMNASTSRQPQVVDNNVKDILDKTKIYSGCYGMAHITLFWYDNESKGIGVSLNSLQKLDDGEPLGGAPPSAASVFSPVKINTKKSAASAMDDDDDEDPMA
jgi:hypothetical protein